MRVLHVIARMNVGGTANYVSKVVQGIPNSKIVIGHVQDYEIEDDVVNSLNFIRINSLGRKISVKNDIRAYLSLRKIIKDMKPDIVHSHTFKAGLLARLIRGNFKKVHTFHGHLLEDNSFSDFKIKIIIIIEKYLATKTDVLVSVGKKVSKDLISNGIGRETHWISIQPGIEPIQILDKYRARKALGINSSSILIGWLARMADVKNPLLFIQLAKSLPDVDFIMGGGGPLLDKIRRDSPKNCKVIGWTDQQNFWSAVDIAVSTSDNEGMSISLIEAQTAGVPAIATEVGSTSEIIENGVSGYLTDKSVENISAKLEILISDSNLRLSFGEAAKVYARNKFNVDAMIKSHQDLYMNLLNKYRRNFD
jgi:glycosyltransferase involved in cell wall biosynthesis